jgi:hypothetical protein
MLAARARVLLLRLRLTVEEDEGGENGGSRGRSVCRSPGVVEYEAMVEEGGVETDRAIGGSGREMGEMSGMVAKDRGETSMSNAVGRKISRLANETFKRGVRTKIPDLRVAFRCKRWRAGQAQSSSSSSSVFAPTPASSLAELGEVGRARASGARTG